MRKLFWIFVTILLQVLVFSNNPVYAANCGGDVQCVCGDTVTSSVVMSSDLYCDSDVSSALIIGANDITINGNNHFIKNGLTLNGANQNGILSNGYSGITISNFSDISNFYRGIVFDNTTNSTISDNVISRNITGVQIGDGSLNNTITRNRFEFNNLLYAVIPGDSTNIFSSNRFFRNITDGIYLSNEQFLQNTLVDNQLFNIAIQSRVVEVGSLVRTTTTSYAATDLVKYCPGCEYQITTSPPEEISYDGYGRANFTPTKIGTYTLNIKATDYNQNIISASYPFFVTSESSPIQSTTKRYYFRSILPNNSHHGNGTDTGSLSPIMPVDDEVLFCGSWIQSSIDDIPTNFLSTIDRIDEHVWYKSDGPGEIGIRGDSSYSSESLISSPILTSASDYSLKEYSFTNLNWAVEVPFNWYGITAKLSGTNVFLKSTSANPSYLDVTYKYTSTPEIASSTNANIQILSAVSDPNNVTDSLITLDNQSTEATSTTIRLIDHSRAFLSATSSIDSSGNSLNISLASLASTTLETVPLDIVPPLSGHIDIVVNTWNTSSPYKKWTETASSLGILVTHSIGDLSPDILYYVYINGSLLGSYTSDETGTITFDYTANDAYENEFEIFYYHSGQSIRPIIMGDSSYSDALENSVDLFGSIVDTGGNNASTRGFEIGLNTEYGSTTSQSGSFDVGQYSIHVSSLLPNTTYHFRPFSINSAGTSYGADLTFSTIPGFSSLETPTATAISATDVTLNTELLAVGADFSYERGFVYGTSLSYGATSTDEGTGLGQYSSNITGLNCGTQYYFAAYATNEIGLVYSQSQTFTTLSCSANTPDSGSNQTPTRSSSGNRMSQSMLALLFSGIPKATSTTMSNCPIGYTCILNSSHVNSAGIYNKPKFTRNLFFGNSGEDVKSLQKYLNAIGYTISKTGPGSIGNETDFFGGLTKGALMKFQKDHGISATGNLGPITRRYIENN